MKVFLKREIMKTLIEILFFLFSTQDTTNLFKCPTDSFNKPINGVFRNPENCGIYHHCINGTAHTGYCPTGLHFQLKLDSFEFITCIEPKYSDCKYGESNIINIFRNREVANATKSIQIKNNTRECFPNKNTTVGNNQDCRIYYHCENGTAWPQKCPQGYSYNPQINFNNQLTRFCAPANESKCSISGQWSEWTKWSECRGNCSSKAKSNRYRYCNNPPPSGKGKNCTGHSVEKQLCEPRNCLILPSFMVSLNESQSLNTFRVNWTQIDVNNTGIFNSTHHYLNIKLSGLYIFSLATTLKSNSNVSLSFVRSGLSAGLSRASSNTIQDTIFREAFLPLSYIFKPSIQQNHNGSVHLISSKNNKETSWSGFYYDTETYFLSAIDRPKRGPSIIQFNFNKYRGFRSSKNIKSSLSSGIFYLSYGVSVPAEKMATIKILTSATDNLNIESTFFNPLNVNDTFTKNLIINSSNAKPKFEVFLESGEVHSDKNHFQTYISAVRLNASKPAFSIQETAQQIGLAFKKLEFSNKIVIDNFNGWNAKNNSYKVPVTGVYYIAINAAVCSSINPTTDVLLQVNGKDYTRMSKDTRLVDPSKSSLLSKSVILNLARNDKIYILFKGCIISTDENVSILNIFKVD